MSRSATNTMATSYCPEFAVTREAFNRYFEKPLPPSTFHDFVNKGKIVPMKGIRGFYLLNDSLRRLGLREVRELPKPPPAPSLDDIVRLAFTLIDRNLFPEPSWLLHVEAIDAKDADHATRLADRCRDKVEAFDHVEAEARLLPRCFGLGVHGGFRGALTLWLRLCWSGDWRCGRPQESALVA